MPSTARRRTALALASVCALLATTSGWAAPPPPSRALGPLGPGYVTARLFAAGDEAAGASSSHDAQPPNAPPPNNPPPGNIGPRYPYEIPRATADRPDIEAGRLVHVIYYLPSDKPDQALDTAGVLDMSAAAQNKWFAAQSGGRRWRFDTFTFQTTVGGSTRRVTALDVTFYRSRAKAAQLNNLETVSNDVFAAGLAQPGKRYLIYAAVDAGTVCGEAFYPLDAATDPAADGQYAAVFLDSPCRSVRDFATSPDAAGMSDAVAQHELMHNDGVVPLAAPHQCQPPSHLHVCTAGLRQLGMDPERYDVMYTSTAFPLRDLRLDIGRDDYFNAPLARPDLKNSPYLTP